MRMLIDDVRIPTEEGWDVLRNPGDAVRFLDGNYEKVTEIQLDHDNTHFADIRGEIVTYHCDCGFELAARFIARLKQVTPAWNPKIIIKSLNPIGSGEMKEILERVGLKTEIIIEP